MPNVSGLGLCVSAFVGALAVVDATSAQADSDFYAGKQITFVVGTAPGGGYDDYVRVLAPILASHIPGRPTIIVQNRSGAGGLNAAAQIYNQAPKDGTLIAICPSVIMLTEALEPSKARFESRNFGWIGTITTLTHVLALTRAAGIATIQDAKTKPAILGATTATGADYIESVMINALLGTQFKIVKGFSSGSQEIALAMERGEVHGFPNSWDSWKGSRSDWIKQGKLSFLLQIGLKVPELPAVPAFSDLVDTPRDKAMVALLELIQTTGRSVFAPPGVPEDRLAILRDAFDKTMKDPTFLARMENMNLDVQPRTWRALQADLDRTLSKKEEAAHDIRAILAAAPTR